LISARTGTGTETGSSTVDNRERLGD